MLHHEQLITVLKNRRNLLRVTQENVAALSGIGLRTLKELESGTGNPTVQTLTKIADVLGLELTLRVKNPYGHQLLQP
jgi:transcriptional regulator with XRE-family HTH domain